MKNDVGNKSVLKFLLHLESVRTLTPGDGTGIALLEPGQRNSVEWMGREPFSCRVIDGFSNEVPIGKDGIDHVEFTILVGYRPPVG